MSDQINWRDWNYPGYEKVEGRDLLLINDIRQQLIKEATSVEGIRFEVAVAEALAKRTGLPVTDFIHPDSYPLYPRIK